MKSLCLKKDFYLYVYDIDSLFVMQNFMKVPFKMTEKLPHTLGGGLKIWASITGYNQSVTSCGSQGKQCSCYSTKTNVNSNLI